MPSSGQQRAGWAVAVAVLVAAGVGAAEAGGAFARGGAGGGARTAGAAAGAGGAAGARTARTGSASSCRPAGARVLASDALAVVYSWHGSVFGCAGSRGPRRNLGGSGFCNLPQGDVAPVTLAGSIVAYGVAHCGIDTGSSLVIVRDLASGRTRASVPAATLPVGPESYERVESVVVRGDGAAGWIARDSSIIRQAVNYEVHRVAGGKGVLLDSGSTIAPTSLRLEGSTMVWRHGSARRSAPLR